MLKSMLVTAVIPISSRMTAVILLLIGVTAVTSMLFNIGPFG